MISTTIPFKVVRVDPSTVSIHSDGAMKRRYVSRDISRYFIFQAWAGPVDGKAHPLYSRFSQVYPPSKNNKKGNGEHSHPDWQRQAGRRKVGRKRLAIN